MTDFFDNLSFSKTFFHENAGFWDLADSKSHLERCLFFQTQMIFLSLSEILTSHSSESGLNSFDCKYLNIPLVKTNCFVKRLLNKTLKTARSCSFHLFSFHSSVEERLRAPRSLILLCFPQVLPMHSPHLSANCSARVLCTSSLVVSTCILNSVKNNLNIFEGNCILWSTPQCRVLLWYF